MSQVRCYERLFWVLLSVILPWMLLSSCDSDVANQTSIPSVADNLATSDVAGDDLLNHVILENTKAAEAVHSLYVKLTWSEASVEPEIPVPGGSVLPGGRRTVRGSATIWQEGRKYHEDFTTHTLFHDSGQNKEEHRIAVFNDHYFAQYYAPHVLMFYHIVDAQTLYSPVDAHVEEFPYPNILNFGFKLIWASLEEQYESSVGNHPDHFRWTVAREPDGHSYRLTNIADFHGQAYVSEEIVADSARGFLVPEYRGYEKDQLSCSMTCDLQEIRDNVWFPMQVSRFLAQNKSTLEIDVLEVRVNEDIDDAVFTLEAMKFDPTDVTMSEYSPGQVKAQAKGFWQDQWVPVGRIPGRGLR